MFTIDDKTYLNLPEQVEKNKTDIATNKTNIETLQNGTTATAIVDKLKGQVLSLAGLAVADDIIVSDGSVDANSLDIASTATVSGTLDVEGKATFGSDAEVDGTLTLNSPENLQFKTGSIEAYEPLANGIAAHWWALRFAGRVLTDVFVSPLTSHAFSATYLGEAFSDWTGCFAGATISAYGGITFPDMTGSKNFDYVFLCAKSSGTPFTVTFNNADLTGDTYGIFQGGAVSTVSVASGKSCKVGRMGNAFRHCTHLTSVTGLDFSSCNNMGSCFMGCTALKTLDCTGIHVSFDISASAQFEESDLVTIINNLETVSTAQTLTMGSTNLAKLTQDEILVATGKGWTLA